MFENASPCTLPGRSRRLVALCALAALLLPAAAAAQRDSGEERFEGTARVFEVRVPVNVSGRHGEPIRGLTAADFQIFDEGTEREITSLEVVDLAQLETGASRTEVEGAIDSAARRHFLLLFDLSFSKPTSLVRAREAARGFVLDSLHPTDLVAVGTHSVDTGARLLVTFTPDRAQVARAIDTLGAPRLLKLTRQDPLRFLIDEPERDFAGTGNVFDVEGENRGITGLQDSVMAHLRVIGNEMAKAERSFNRGRISSWSRSMGDLARMLDSVSGRKHVVYFSEGFDGRLLLGRDPNAADPAYRRDRNALERGDFWAVDSDDLYGNTSLQSSMSHMLDQFKRSDVVIQAVDISGLRADSAAEHRLQNSGEHALFYIADTTGGQLFEDANDFGAELDRVLESSSVTYLLSFRADDVPADGSFRRLKVKANLPRGARLVARQGYYAPRPYEELHPVEKGLLASDAIAAAAPRSELSLNVLAAPFRADAQSAYIPIIIEAAGGPLLADHEGSQLPVEFYAYVTDERGEMRDFFTQLVSLDLGQRRDQFAQAGLKYFGHLDLPPGDYLVRVLVRNAQTGRSGVETLDLTVPAYEVAETVLLPPFFLEDEANWVLVREKQPVEYQGSVVYPFTVKGQPYVPAARPSLDPSAEARICLVAYNLGGDIELDGTIVAEDGTIVREGGDLALVERTVTGIDGLDKLLATFRPGSLGAGRYTLQVMLTDRATGSAEVNSIPFVLRN
ncbi:MAG: VWA domain-containing protein [Thermoanaerobaculia bacterium]|nr:VWA domain-containing protein [Thermoanaerobaculia bacterium]